MKRPSVRRSREFRPTDTGPDFLEARALRASLDVAGPQISAPSDPALADTPSQPTLAPTTSDVGVGGPPGPDDFMVTRAFTPGDTSDKATSEEAIHSLEWLSPGEAFNISNDGTIGQEAILFGQEFGAADTSKKEAFRHAYWQAWMYIHYSPDKAEAIGDIHETYGGKPDRTKAEKEFDDARDQWNNDKGRLIGGKVQAEGFWFQSSEKERIKELIKEAWKNGEFITGDDDPRIEENKLIEKERIRQEQHRARDEAAAKEYARQQDARLLYTR